MNVRLVLVVAQLLFTSGPASVVVSGYRSAVGSEVAEGSSDRLTASGSVRANGETRVVGGIRCRCAPDQWEGLLVSREREFEARDGSHPTTVESSVSVHYDFVNERFAMTDLTTGRRTVADYKQGFKYIIHRTGCVRIRTDDPMTKMCLPVAAQFVGDFVIGADVGVGIWQFTSEYNVSTRTTVMTKNCVPISEEIFMVERAHSSLTTSQYIDVSLGIRDEDVFVAPPICNRPMRILARPLVDANLQQQQLRQQIEEDTKRKRSSHQSASSFTQKVYDQMNV